ncbi:redoxin family protein [Methylocystis echinoides]|uniref:redoxin family protein n=1 Tax=Methylocystis echinoides TaxID=29468 RepID=UPI00343A41DD
MTASADAPKKVEWFATRRSLVLGAMGVMGLGAGGAVVEHVWKKKDMTARLFNPFSLARFELPPVEGLLDASGKPLPGLSSADLAGKRCLLNFWASWCPTCRDEHKHLMALAKRNLAPIYGVDVKDPPARARYFLAKYGNPFAAVGADTETYVQRALGARGVPATFVIGPGPIIEWSTYEGLTEAVVDREIAPRLGRGPSLPAGGERG